MKWQFVGHTPFPNYFFSLLNQQVGWYTRHVWSNRHGFVGENHNVLLVEPPCLLLKSPWLVESCWLVWSILGIILSPLEFGGFTPTIEEIPRGDVTPIIWVFIQPRYFMWLSHIFHPLDPIFTFLPQKSCQKLPLRPETPRRVARGDLASAARQTEGPPSRRDDWGLPKLGQVQHGLEWEYMGIYIYKYIYRYRYRYISIYIYTNIYIYLFIYRGYNQQEGDINAYHDDWVIQTWLVNFLASHVRLPENISA